MNCRRELEAQIAGLRREVCGLQNQLANARGQAGRLSGTLQSSQLDVAGLRAQIASRNDEIQRLSAQLADLGKRPNFQISGTGSATHGVGQLGQINHSGANFHIG